MKIYINYDYEEHDRICSIQTLGYWLAKGKSEQQLDETVAKRNAEAGWQMFRTMEISDDMEAVLRFALGENEYKSYADITDVYNKLREVETDLDSMREDCFHMSEWVENTVKKVRELVPEEDR